MNYASMNQAGLQAAATQAMQSPPSFDVGPGRWFGTAQAPGLPPQPAVQDMIPVQHGHNGRLAALLAQGGQNLGMVGGLAGLFRHLYQRV